MAKLVLFESTNNSQIFGSSEYAMFLAQTEDNQIVEIGITHNCLTRKGIDVDNLDALIGCSVITKEYTDSRTGEIVNPEDRLQKILDGEGRVMLLTSVSCTIRKSELYLVEQKEMVASINAKAKVEFARERKQKQLQQSMDRIRAKALAAITSSKDDTKPEEEEEVPESFKAEETLPENFDLEPEVTEDIPF